MADCMTFPKKWEQFLHDYEFEDSRRIYTNGSRLIPSFRVKQMMEHYLLEAKTEAIKEFSEMVNPIIEQIIEIMFDDNQSKCMIKNCHKHSSIPCESGICIEENKSFWKLKIYDLVKEMTEERGNGN